eukprot:scaffold1379_cov209-Alexandrium_tamarense.AAC.28
MDDTFFANPNLTAPFLYDTTIALGLAECNVSSSDNSYFDGRTHYDQVLKTTFEGTTGDIVLDLSTESYMFKGGKWETVVPLVFNDGTNVVQPDLPRITLDKNNIGTGLRASGLFMSSIIVVLCIGLASWMWVNRNSQEEKASQPVFLLLLLGGVFLMGVSIIPLSFDDEIASGEGCSAACMSVPWLLCTGFSISFAARHRESTSCSTMQHYVGFKFLQGMSRNLLRHSLHSISFCFLFGLGCHLSSRTEKYLRLTLSTGRWRASASVLSDSYLPFVILLVVLNLSVLSFAMYQAYHAPVISLEFAESEYIAKAIAACLLVCFVGIPIMIIVTKEPKAYFFVLASIIFVLCSSLMLFIFVPKIISHRSKDKNKLKSAIRSSAVTERKGSFNSSTSNASVLISTSNTSSESGVKIVDHPALCQAMKNDNVTWQLQYPCVRFVEKEADADIAVDSNDDDGIVEDEEVPAASKEDEDEANVDVNKKSTVHCTVRLSTTVLSFLQSKRLWLIVPSSLNCALESSPVSVVSSTHSVHKALPKSRSSISNHSRAPRRIQVLSFVRCNFFTLHTTTTP